MSNLPPPKAHITLKRGNSNDGVMDNIYNENEFLQHLKKLRGSVCIDKSNLPFAAYQSLLDSKATLDPRGDITALPKACKNEIELSRARDAHLIDAIAMCKFLHWLNSQPLGMLTEIDLVISLESFRSANPEFYDISFETICASGQMRPFHIIE